MDPKRAKVLECVEPLMVSKSTLCDTMDTFDIRGMMRLTTMLHEPTTVASFETLSEPELDALAFDWSTFDTMIAPAC